MRLIAEGRVAVRRSRHAVRHHHQRLAHLPGDAGASTRATRAPSTCSSTTSACNLASLNLMKFLNEDGVVRRRGLPPRGPHHDHAQEILVDNARYPTETIAQEQPRLPSARPRLRQPRRAADGARPAVRLAAGPRLRRVPHGDHDRRGLRAVGAHRARDRPVRRLRGEPRADAPRHAQAPRGGVQHPHRQRRGRPHRARRGTRGTRRSSSAPGTATATRRRRCSRRPARSAS